MTVRLRRWCAVCAAAACILSARLCSAQEDQTPLFEQASYDQITLDEHNDSLVVKVLPLDFPNRRVPDPFPRAGKIEVRKLEEPETLYEIQWHSIARIELFEQLVLNKANELVAGARFDEAYEYFDFLLEKDPEWPGLSGAIDNYIYEEAKFFHRGGRYEEALARLRELRERNSQFPGLENALGMASEKLVEGYVEADNYRTARQLLRNLAELYPRHAVVEKWEDRFSQQAADLLSKGREAVESGRFRDAHQLGRRMMHIWPDLPGGKTFIDSVQKGYPRVVVGVTTPAAVHEPSRLHDWGSRRSSRLAWRTLIEFLGRGTEGGNYLCPLGRMRFDKPSRRLTFHVDPSLDEAGNGDGLTGYDLARQLLAMADDEHPAYRLDWAELAGPVSVRDVYQVTVDLRRSHVCPEALLRPVVISQIEPSRSADSPPSDGPYLIDSQSADEVVYRVNPQSPPVSPGQPREIIERHFREGDEAIRALEQHDIDVLDRVNPWDLEKVRSMTGVVVERYAMPLVHCLVPNPRKPFTARREFRRALVYGIHRESILNRLLRNQPVAGCQVISGPFSPGISHDDPLDYAYDDGIEPRAYDPRLAVALAQVTLSDVAEAKEKEGVKVTDKPEFVLAHPAHEIARVACRSIQRQLALVEIHVRLQELPPELPPSIPEDVDILYAEVAMWEPAVDARRLLDEDGLCGASSPYMSYALRQLGQAADWGQVSDLLRHIHGLVHTEVSVVPLWQLTDHFAYHRSLGGVGSSPVSLYQNVEMWQPAAEYVAGGK